MGGSERLEPAHCLRELPLGADLASAAGLVPSHRDVHKALEEGAVMDGAGSYPETPTLGFGGHTDTAGLRRAHEAGFDQVLVKNALQERAAQVVDELIA